MDTGAGSRPNCSETNRPENLFNFFWVRCFNRTCVRYSSAMQSTTAEAPQLLDLSGFGDAALRGLLGEVIDILADRDPSGTALLDAAV